MVLFDDALAEIEKAPHVPRARHRSCGHEKMSVYCVECCLLIARNPLLANNVEPNYFVLAFLPIFVSIYVPRIPYPKYTANKTLLSTLIILNFLR